MSNATVVVMMLVPPEILPSTPQTQAALSCPREVRAMTATDEYTEADVQRAVANIETMLTLVAHARRQPDPCDWLTNRLIDLREAVRL